MTVRLWPAMHVRLHRGASHRVDRTIGRESRFPLTWPRTASSWCAALTSAACPHNRSRPAAAADPRRAGDRQVEGQTARQAAQTNHPPTGPPGATEGRRRAPHRRAGRPDTTRHDTAASPSTVTVDQATPRARQQHHCGRVSARGCQAAALPQTGPAQTRPACATVDKAMPRWPGSSQHHRGSGER
jgi:hypothetical protein